MTVTERHVTKRDKCDILTVLNFRVSLLCSNEIVDLKKKCYRKRSEKYYATQVSHSQPEIGAGAKRSRRESRTLTDVQGSVRSEVDR